MAYYENFHLQNQIAALNDSEPPSNPVPVSLVMQQMPRSSRLLLFVKWLCFPPLVLWIAIYGIVASLCAFVAFWAILFTGRYPLGLFDFVRGYIEAQWRVYSYFPLLTSDRWRTTSPSPVNLYINPPEKKLSRLVLLFIRLPFFLTGGVTNLANFSVFIGFLVATPAWFAILVTGHYPGPLFRFNARMSQWAARLTAWQFMMSDDWRLFGERKWVRIVTFIAAILFAIASVSSTIYFRSQGGAGFGSLFGLNKVHQTVDRYIRDGRDNNIDDAVNIVDPTLIGRRALTSEFKDRSSNYAGFRSTKVRAWRIRGSGRYAAIEGYAYYDDGSRRTFDAYLIKSGGQWLIQNIFFVDFSIKKGAR